MKYLVTVGVRFESLVMIYGECCGLGPEIISDIQQFKLTLHPHNQLLRKLKLSTNLEDIVYFLCMIQTLSFYTSYAL